MTTRLLTFSILVMLAGSHALALQDNKSTGSGQTRNTSQSSERGRSATTASSMDRQFVEKAASGGLMEVELGQIAQQNASSSEVKAFGARMVADHGKANEELKAAAAAAGISLPADMTAEHKAHVSKLRNHQGNAFDRAYVQDMLKDHQKDVAEFEKAAQSATQPEIKNFAARTLPVLREHLQQIQSIHVRSEGAGATRQKSSQ